MRQAQCAGIVPQINQSLTLLAPIAAGFFVVSVVAIDSSVNVDIVNLVPSYIGA
ncbi:hypothetical protein [Bradyrhizobium sp. LB13.1]